MRSILGLALLVAVSLGSIEYATKFLPTNAATSAQPMQATLLAPALAPATETFGGIVQTVAATAPAPLPPVTVAPLAPRAEPINPIVEPIKRPPPVAKTIAKPAPAKAAVHKTHPAKTKGAKAKDAKRSATPDAPIVTVTRPGFKLTCTLAQNSTPPNNAASP